MRKLGLYIHIPFCNRKCGYCDFYSVIPNENIKAEYLSALSGDIKKWGGRLDRPFDTVYIGGGTPSILEDDISDLLKAVKSYFNITKDAEITAEVNPDVSDLFLESAVKSGVNRISIGIQSGIDSELEKLGRTHTESVARNAVSRIKKAGFTNISADLMIGLPKSNADTLKRNLEYFISLEIPHISSYILKIEENTRFFVFPPEMPCEDDICDQYLFMCEYLEKNGYEHYEISNFAKKGFCSKHNLKYWNCEEYLGLGPSAHSFLDGKRFYYEKDIKKFIKNPQTVFDCLGGQTEEKIMLSLRLSKGTDLSPFMNESLSLLIKNLKNSGYIKVNNNCISLTNKGMLVSNSIISVITENINENI